MRGRTSCRIGGNEIEDTRERSARSRLPALEGASGPFWPASESAISLADRRLTALFPECRAVAGAVMPPEAGIQGPVGAKATWPPRERG